MRNLAFPRANILRAMIVSFTKMHWAHLVGFPTLRRRKEDSILNVVTLFTNCTILILYRSTDVKFIFMNEETDAKLNSE